jgi:hypothetical protein
LNGTETGSTDSQAERLLGKLVASPGLVPAVSSVALSNPSASLSVVETNRKAAGSAAAKASSVVVREENAPRMASP